jgi:hypothetical protein
MSEKCPRCGAAKMIPGVPLLDHYGDTGTWSRTARVEVHGVPEAWLFKDTVAGRLSVRICGGCGHAELQVRNFRELYEKYVKSRQPRDTEKRAVEMESPAAPPTPIHEDACLSCGKPIPGDATGCPACGWTWSADVKPVG